MEAAAEHMDNFIVRLEGSNIPAEKGEFAPAHDVHKGHRKHSTVYLPLPCTLGSWLVNNGH